MCGRDSQFFTWREIHAFSGGLAVSTPAQDPEPNYNRAPTQAGWVLVADGDGAVATEMRWGLLPSWAKDTRLAYSTINARCETAATKPVFREAWQQRRGLVPSSGYYEWRMEDGAKQPYFIHARSSPVLFFAGLWEQRGELLTYSIVTRDADPAIAHLHDRMPLALPTDLLHGWMTGTPQQGTEIALAAKGPELEWHRVDKAVGNVRSTGPRLVEPLAPQLFDGTD
ncbi:SOS response-associated peptidase [Lysobacter ciconiae]|uniref:Abasic site processing protein n=1 Tax=Novilysobacter ciconiae TaxID=2781022 RepID=A0A7S6UFR7_9GAMM|nr:SOS response-associated peptidase [Lysobacter ciconiae]QOW19440.1 SOS response-associated peptidase [Lysobacter ciconiae]